MCVCVLAPGGMRPPDTMNALLPASSTTCMLWACRTVSSPMYALRRSWRWLSLYGVVTLVFAFILAALTNSEREFRCVAVGVSGAEDEWVETLAAHLGEDYVELAVVSLWKIRLAVFVRRAITNRVTNAQVRALPCRPSSL